MTDPSLPPNTIGLGEYTDRDLLAELVERGVVADVIGLDEELPDGTAKWTTGVMVRNEVRAEQHQRVQTLLKEPS